MSLYRLHTTVTASRLTSCRTIRVAQRSSPASRPTPWSGALCDHSGAIPAAAWHSGTCFALRVGDPIRSRAPLCARHRHSGATAPARAAPSPRVVGAVLPARLRAKRRAGFSLLVTPLDSLAGPFAGRSRPKPEMRSPPKRPARAKGAHVGDEAASDRGRQFYGPKRHGLEIGALTANSEIRPPRRREPRSGSSNAAGVSVPELPIPGDCQRREQHQRNNFFRV